MNKDSDTAGFGWILSMAGRLELAPWAEVDSIYSSYDSGQYT